MAMLALAKEVGALLSEAVTRALARGARASAREKVALALDMVKLALATLVRARTWALQMATPALAVVLLK